MISRNSCEPDRFKWLPGEKVLNCVGKIDARCAITSNYLNAQRRRSITRPQTYVPADWHPMQNDSGMCIFQLMHGRREADRTGSAPVLSHRLHRNAFDYCSFYRCPYPMKNQWVQPTYHDSWLALLHASIYVFRSSNSTKERGKKKFLKKDC